MLIFAATASAYAPPVIWSADNETGSGYDGTTGVERRSWRHQLSAASVEPGQWDNIAVCFWAHSGASGATDYTGLHICEQASAQNCTAGTITYFPDLAMTVSNDVLCVNATDTTYQVNGSKTYLVGFYPKDGHTNSVKYWNAPAPVRAWYGALNTNLTASDEWGSVTNLALYLGMYYVGGSVPGASIASINPNGAPYNEAQTFTAVPAGNSSDATGWWWSVANGGTTYFTSTGAITSTQTLNVTGNWSVTVIGTFGAANATTTENVTVTARPVANFTYTGPIYMGSTYTFNDTSTDPGGFTISNWYWDEESDGTIDSTNQNASITFATAGYQNVSLIVANEWGVNSSTPSAPPAMQNVTVNGLLLDVFDEKTWANITNWTVTFSNSTATYTFTDRNNTLTWNNFSTIPTGALTIVVTASGYIGRTYYRSWNVGTPLNLDTYLLSTTDGVYSYFLVQNTLGTAISGALLIFTFTNGSATVTAGEIKTDDTGSATMWLDWTKTHIVTATAEGYSPVSKSLTPQPTTYVIIMGSASVFNYTALNSSLWVFMEPVSPEINTGTDSIVAGVFDPDSSITICGVNLTFTNGTLFNSTNVTTEQQYCVVTVPLLDSGAHGLERFRAYLWWEANVSSADVGEFYRTYVNETDYLLNDVQSGLFNYLGGDEARLMVAVLVTLLVGAAGAMYIGSGVVPIMIAVSGMFVMWGWFGAYWMVWVVAAVGGLAVMYLERGGG